VEAGRKRWTDERIDDLAKGVREELRELRSEMREGFRGVRSEIAELRSDTNAGFRAVHAEIGLNRRWLAGMWVMTLLGFLGLLLELHLR
jgi:hypothetical protein